MYHQKKGQVTYFIVIAVVLLFLAIFLFSMREDAVFVPREAPAVQEAPFAADPIHNFVTECLAQKSAEAITLLGRHGGYIDPTSPVYDTQPLRTNPAMPTEADALTFSDGWHVAYWDYMERPNSGAQGYEFSSKMPNEQMIASQISRYVETRLDECLNSFSSFASQGYSVQPIGGAMPSAKTFLGAETVVVELTYPLRVARRDGSGGAGSAGGAGGAASFELRTFRATHELALSKLLLFAESTIQKMSRARSLENVIKTVISTHAGLENDLPPLSETQLGGMRYTWSETMVRQKLETLLSYSLNQLQLRGTAGYEPPEQRDPSLLQDPVRRGVTSFLNTLDVSDISGAARYAVELEYNPSWPSYFDVVSGELIGPSSEFKPPFFSGVLGVLQLPNAYRSYTTPYDVSLPVLMQFTDTQSRFKDPFSPNTKGYTLMLALEANLRDNHPLVSSYQPTSLYIGYETGFSPLCTDAQRTSAPVTVTVTDAASTDAANRQQIQNAAVSFGGCSITAGDSPLTSKFPVGALELEVSAPGYLSVRVPLITSLTREKQVSVALQPLQDVAIRVQKYTYEKQPASMGIVRDPETDAAGLWELSRDRLKPLLVNEQTIVTFERVSTDGISYATAVPVRGTETATVKLAPGRYKITTLTMLYEQVIIPACPECCSTFEPIRISRRQSASICLVPVRMPEQRQQPFMEGSVETIAEITPRMLQLSRADTTRTGTARPAARAAARSKPLIIPTFVLNMRDVPVERNALPTPPLAVATLMPYGALLYSREQINERMLTDLTMIEKMRTDAQRPDIAPLLAPR